MKSAGAATITSQSWSADHQTVHLLSVQPVPILLTILAVVVGVSVSKSLLDLTHVIHQQLGLGPCHIEEHLHGSRRSRRCTQVLTELRGARETPAPSHDHGGALCSLRRSEEALGTVAKRYSEKVSLLELITLRKEFEWQRVRHLIQIELINMLSSNEEDKSGIENTIKKEENCQCEPNIKKLKLEKTLDIKDNSSGSNPCIDVKRESLEIDVTAGDSSEVPKLSKRQLKKIKKKEKWLELLPAKRAKERERLKQRKLEARLNNQPLGPSRKTLKNSKMSESKCKVRVAIDTSFDDLMNNKDTNKCVNQLLRCYSANRRASNPIQLYFTSFVGNTKTEMAKLTGYTNWDVNFKSESYMDIFDKNELIYLSSDSDNIITTLEDNKVYIIGGLVDHNSQKHRAILFYLYLEAVRCSCGLHVWPHSGKGRFGAIS
uniref:tRNA (guanine(9)-N(1))-methyltransferase n=1 Tax=Timema genevievae TaxID=629358 RepID=A0A7R9JQP3_TIMGE|nr:unnamed protein product [Timema genevievae]